MTLYPEVQHRAQEQLHEVIGSERLPGFNDIDSLPYISAIIKELLRWQPVVPLGVPHRAITDDVYNNQYFIPKGSVVIGNVWCVIANMMSEFCSRFLRAILHNPETYPCPEEFRPERFLLHSQLDPNVRDPELACFGFGRRFASNYGCSM